MPRPILSRLRLEKKTSPRSVPKITMSMASATRRLMLWTPTRSTRREPRPLAAGSFAARDLVEAVHWIAPSALGRRLRHGVLQDRRLVDVGPRQFGGDPASRHDEHAVGEPDQFRHLRRDQDDTDAACRQLVDQPVDLGLGADVDAARRLVEDEQHRLPGQPARQHDLLLVAAGQLRNLFVEVGRLDRHLGGQRRDDLQRLAPVEDAEGRGLVGNAERGIVEDAAKQQQGLVLAVLRARSRCPRRSPLADCLA